MKIAIVGDPHFDHARVGQIDALHKELADITPDWVMFTGDMGEAPNVCTFLEGFADKPYKLAIVHGNHCCYRGSIAETKRKLREFAKKHENIYYVSGQKHIEMGEGVNYLSIDSWYDGYHGDFMGSQVWLNDFLFISEFSGMRGNKQAILLKMQEISHGEVAGFKKRLSNAFKDADQVVLMMHVPPFPESSVYNGKQSDSNWLPFFTTKLAGDIIMDVMGKLPDKNLLVICGHSHGSAEFRPLPNTLVITAEAKYGYPRVSRILEV